MKLSVAIITYNHEHYIRQALESVLAQQVNFEYEIIVGEDCSTDRTRDIVLDFCRRYPDRIVPLLRDRNIGGARNLIATLNECRGEYLIVLEGDDYWLSSDKLQKQVDFLDQHPDYVICCHRVQVCDETGAGQGGILPQPLRFQAGSYTIKDLIAEHFIYTCTAMYRSSSAQPAPGWIVDVGPGDWARNILAARSGEIQLMDDVMAVYRVHPGGVWSSKPVTDRLRDGVRMLRAVDRHLHFQYTGAITRTVALHYFEMATLERQNGNRGATMKHLVACVRFGRRQLPGRLIVWASLLAYAVFGLRRLRWWKGSADANAL